MAFVLHHQPDNLEPGIILVHPYQRIDASNGNPVRRVDIISIEFIEMERGAGTRHVRWPNNAMAHLVAGESEGYLRYNLLPVSDGHTRALVFCEYVREHDSLTPAGRQHRHDIARALMPSGVYLLLHGALKWSELCGHV